jgi:homoserine kinase
VVVEPYRKKLIPNFDDLKLESLNVGALGCGISGSGPSIYALSKGKETALEVEKAMQQVYSKTEIPFYTFVSKINTEGIKIL